MCVFFIQNLIGRILIGDIKDAVVKERLEKTSIKGNTGDGNIPSYYVLASDADFEGVSDGNFVYIGNDDFVVIPDKIKGVDVTAYSNMFCNKFVKGVTANNKNVIKIGSMFCNCELDTFDLSYLDTSSVSGMIFMFSNSKIGFINFGDFDTLNVTDMYGMLYFLK